MTELVVFGKLKTWSYSLITQQWSRFPDPSCCGNVGVSVMFNLDILLTGGDDEDTNQTQFSPVAQTDTWAVDAPRKAPRPSGQMPVVLQDTNKTEIFSKVTRTWNAGPPMIEPRSSHVQVTLLDGRTLVVGGASNDKVLESGEMFSPSSQTWQLITPMPSPRSYAVGVMLPSGNVLVTGGADGSKYLSSSVMYSPSEDRWTEVASMSTPRSWAAGCLLAAGNVLVVGGYNGKQGCLGTCETYDELTNTWNQNFPCIAIPRCCHKATLISDQVYITGGKIPKDPNEDSDCDENCSSDDSFSFEESLKDAHWMDVYSVKKGIWRFEAYEPDAVDVHGVVAYSTERLPSLVGLLLHHLSINSRHIQPAPRLSQ